METSHLSTNDALFTLGTGRFAPKQTGTPYVTTSGYGAARIAQVDSPGAELTRAGRRFSLSTLTSVTGIAPTQVINTVVTNWMLYNTSTTDSFIFDELGVLLVSGTAGLGITVMACLFTAPVQTGFATGINVASRSNSARTSAMSVKSGVSISAPAAPAWFPIAYSGLTASAVLSVLTVSDKLEGKLICPPQFGIGIHVLSPAGSSPLYAPHASWTEAAMDLE